MIIFWLHHSWCHSMWPQPLSCTEKMIFSKKTVIWPVCIVCCLRWEFRIRFECMSESLLHIPTFQLPEDLPFEYLLQNAEKLYAKHPPEQIELDVQQMIIREYVYLGPPHSLNSFRLNFFFFAESNSVRRKPKKRQNVACNCNERRPLKIQLSTKFCHKCSGRDVRCLWRQHFR